MSTQRTVTRTRTKVPVAVGTRVLEVAPAEGARLRYWGYGSPDKSVRVLRMGAITKLDPNYVLITWDGDAGPTMHAWWDMTRWDAHIAAYHENGTQLFVNQFEEVS